MKDIITYITESKKLSKQNIVTLFKTIDWKLTYKETDDGWLDIYDISSKDFDNNLMLMVSTENNEFWISSGNNNYFYDSDEESWTYDDRYPEELDIHMKLTLSFVKQVLTKDNYKDFLSVITQ